jgi:hypothetical protein
MPTFARISGDRRSLGSDERTIGHEVVLFIAALRGVGADLAPSPPTLARSGQTVVQSGVIVGPVLATTRCRTTA